MPVKKPTGDVVVRHTDGGSALVPASIVEAHKAGTHYPEAREPRACEVCKRVRTVKVSYRFASPHRAELPSTYALPPKEREAYFREFAEAEAKDRANPVIASVSWSRLCEACKLEASAREHERTAWRLRMKAAKLREKQRGGK